MVKSPGVPAESPLAAAARARAIPVWSEIELGYRLLPGNPLIGVTGTNGKTTTAELLGAMFARRRPAASRSPATSAAPSARSRDGIEPGRVGRLRALELPARGRARRSPATSPCCSTSSPTISTATGRSRPIATPSSASSSAPHTKIVRAASASTAIEFGADDPLPAEPLIPGAHNRENAAAATAAARAAGVGDEAIAEALRTFQGVPHRLELVRELRGVRYVNDSKATNTAAARRGVAAYDAPLHLILGGSLKGEDFAPFVRDLPATVRSVYLIGEATDELARALDASWPRVRRATATSRLRCAHAAADAEPGDVVLLSPACASFDQFDNFEQRGDAFRAARRGARMSRGRTGQRSFEWQLLVLVTLALTAFGLVMVYSATSASAALGNGNPTGYLERQAIYALIGFALLVAAARTDFRKLRALAPPLVVAALATLPRRARDRPAVNGARRWIGLGPATFQPSELAKLALVVWARPTSPASRRRGRSKELARPIGLLVGVFCVLVLVEPDLGTVITIVVMVGAMLLVAGHAAADAGARVHDRSPALGAIAAWSSPYRRARLFTFLDPWKDPLGAGLQNVQAQISLGSGGIFGRGLGQGIEKIHYLPEAHTDMIFAVIGEELGLVGAAVLIARLLRLRLRGPPARDRLQGSVRKAARGGHHGARLRAGGDQPRRRARARAADRNPAPVRVVRRLEPRGGAPLRRHPP